MHQVTQRLVHGCRLLAVQWAPAHQTAELKGVLACMC